MSWSGTTHSARHQAFMVQSRTSRSQEKSKEMFGYRVPAPDEAMLISGGRGANGAPFRVVTGHGAFVAPIFRKVRYLTLAMQEAEVGEQCVTKQGITLSVRAVIAFKVGNDAESIINAGQRFLSDQNQMPVLTGRIFAGHLRSIIGSMTVEEIVTERQKLAIEVLDGSKSEMAAIGLTVDALQIQSIDDMGAGYIKAMAAPHQAAIQRQAKIAQAQAQAGQAGPLTQAQAQMEVIAAQADLAKRQAELRERQLVAEVVKPAEAEAEKVRILAQADAERMRLQAAAAASHDRVALDRMLIEQLPQIVREAAAGLAGANVSVLNGADGLSEVAAGLVAQGMTILDSVKKGLVVDQPIPRRAAELAAPVDGKSAEQANG